MLYLFFVSLVIQSLECFCISICLETLMANKKWLNIHIT